MAGGVGGVLVTARLTNIMAEWVLMHCLIMSLIFLCGKLSKRRRRLGVFSLVRVVFCRVRVRRAGWVSWVSHQYLGDAKVERTLGWIFAGLESWVRADGKLIYTLLV